ncbi:MAG: flagellar export protein FliJ [Burkholderiales bacterium]|jgi:flagellar FliJ protein|uniref:Flagellar FliJ protein n=1 Tax=Candidatus Desulfobacillus denitrificans TaxID=2608985 RepID=A0A809RYY5_9PROT|nr:flagellar export protein FliJ [Zoogloeaceae bacterium]MBP9653528.1 flagellar export protein FliJ [Rhodocyclaceae bacterium]MCZ2175576.1 flagellar export protein FliJ [Burkholderiales bacterium]OQY67028.1 MAG: flagellar export protein FliJ [Rhodocyclaceae bacterium UTPRO2]BBO21406.1 flagellar export protein FliJ [Candidatus Desulfobacillus denitrificans]GIK46197.1 MAG: flagellar protein FliJ [Betaproteobacteria bacterium]
MKAFPLQSLLELSNARKDDAARKLGQLLASEQEVEKTLALLEQYREEYETRFRQAAQNGLSRDEWGNYQSFLGRLDEAIAQQRALVQSSKQRTVDGQREWLDKRNRAKAFDTLSQRHRAQEAHSEAKTEQRAQDEHAAKSHRGDGS